MSAAFTSSVITGDPESVLARTRAWAANCDRLLLHLAFDVMDYDKFPIAEKYGPARRTDLAALGRLIAGLASLPNWRALTLTEINPDHAPDELRSFTALISMLTNALAPAASRAHDL